MLNAVLHSFFAPIAALDDESHPGDEASQQRALENTASALTSTQVKCDPVSRGFEIEPADKAQDQQS